MTTLGMRLQNFTLTMDSCQGSHPLVKLILGRKAKSGYYGGYSITGRWEVGQGAFCSGDGAQPRISSNPIFHCCGVSYPGLEALFSKVSPDAILIIFSHPGNTQWSSQRHFQPRSTLTLINRKTELSFKF
jgi:hypothetical protein